MLLVIPTQEHAADPWNSSYAGVHPLVLLISQFCVSALIAELIFVIPQDVSTLWLHGRDSLFREADSTEWIFPFSFQGLVAASAFFYA